MEQQRRLVVDANILLRGVFGVRVLNLFEAHEDLISFFAPEVCFRDAQKYIPLLSRKRGFEPTAGFATLKNFERIVQIVEPNLYSLYENQALNRIRSRDAGDWPILATSLLLNCPLWTEDRDFFGTGVATWTTANIEIYLRGE